MGSDGNLYVADTYNNCIRKVTLPVNVVTTHAGVCQYFGGASDGAAAVAQFTRPQAVAAGPNGVIYVHDGDSRWDPYRVRKISMS
uniref:SMP-30/Gluconolactonase/LRE-like region domain-containing protein n=1 Tax=Globisporangium ultimum (strain ATCC 200006 / CBS 805.95 / DAOM BR144) TaxID=431595 RepID=K3WXT8_GLOUD